MFKAKKILVPIDFSEESKLALEAADIQAKEWDADLVLLYVKPPTDLPRTRLMIEDNALQRWGRFIRHTPTNRVTYITRVGDPVKEILRIAAQYAPRKIIMGRGGNEQQPGSISKAVGNEFPGNVEVISQRHDDVFVHSRGS